MLPCFLFIFTPQAAVTIIRQPPDGFNLTPGQQYSMVCFHSDLSAPLRWYQDSMPIATGPLYNVTSSTDEHGRYLKLTILSASLNTRGRFQCSNQKDFFDYAFRTVDVSYTANPGDGTSLLTCTLLFFSCKNNYVCCLVIMEAYRMLKIHRCLNNQSIQ